MKKSILTFTICLVSLVSNAQSINIFYQSIIEQCENDTIYKNLQEFENFGIKQHGNPALLNTFNWLIGKYQSYGYSDFAIDTFEYQGEECYNLIVSKTGTKYPDKYLIIDSHYDTWGGPGSDDNGTGTTIILEIARLLKDIDTEYSIRFCAFSGEEVGLIGSTHYVENVVVPEEHDIKLVFNIDCVGGVNGEVNDIVTCERDEDPPNSNNLDSELYTDTLCTLISLYSDLTTHITPAWGTDYIPFMDAGYVITGIYENNINYNCHGPNDIIANLDTAYLFQVVKASIGTGLYFAGAYDAVGILDINESPEFHIYPNPARDQISISIPDYSKASRLTVYNMAGELVLDRTINANFQQINIQKLKSGIYSLNIEWNNSARSNRRFMKL